LCHKSGYLALILVLVFLIGYSRITEAEVVLHTAVSIEERYESNFLREAKGSEVDDYVSILHPGFTVEGNWKKLSLTGSYLADVVKPAVQTKFDHTEHSLSLDMKASPWAKTSINMTENATFSPNAFDIIAAGKSNVLTQYTDVFFNSSYGKLSHNFTDRTSMTLFGEYTLEDFSEPSLVDTITYTGGIDSSYSIIPKWTVFSNYKFTRYSFDRGMGGSTDVHLANVGIRGEFSKSLSVELAGGAAYTPGVSSSVDIGKNAKWVGEVQLVQHFRKSEFTLKYARGISNAGGISSELSLNDTISIGAHAELTDYLGLSFAGIYGKQRSAPDRILDTQYYSVDLSGDWRISRRFSLSGGYSHYAQLPSGAMGAKNVDGNIVFIKLAVLIYENRL